MQWKNAVTNAKCLGTIEPSASRKPPAADVVAERSAKAAPIKIPTNVPTTGKATMPHTDCALCTVRGSIVYINV